MMVVVRGWRSRITSMLWSKLSFPLSLFLTLDFFLFVWLCGYKIITSKTIIIIIIIISSSYCNVLPTFTLFFESLCLLTYWLSSETDFNSRNALAGWLADILQRQQTSTNPIQSSVNECLCMCVCELHITVTSTRWLCSLFWLRPQTHWGLFSSLFISRHFPSTCVWCLLNDVCFCSLKYNSHLGPH